MRQGQAEAGLQRMRAGLTGVRALGAEVGWPFVLSLLIDCSEGDDARELLAEASSHAEAMEYFNRPILACLEGEKNAVPDRLLEARELARAWGSPWTELRALVAWSRLQGETHPDLEGLLAQLPEARGSWLAAEAQRWVKVAH